MARPLRIEFAGALYHLTARFRWRTHAYCLMDNHYHLLVETPAPNLSRGMRQLNGVYTQRFNRRHGRVGHLFQGRFTAILVERDAYLLALVRYVVLNPVRAGMVRRAQDWRWSSYRASAGLAAAPAWLETGWLLRQFARTKAAARTRYRRFVAEGRNAPPVWEGLRDQIYLGGEAFADALKARAAGEEMAEIPRAQRTAPPPLAALGRVCRRERQPARGDGACLSFGRLHDEGHRRPFRRALRHCQPRRTRLRSDGNIEMCDCKT